MLATHLQLEKDVTNPIPETQAEFVVSYDGEALRNHTMAIRDLAPALLALEQAFSRANSILNGERAALLLEVRANTAGSFEIELLLRQAYENAVGAFSGDFVTSAANIKELFFGNPLLPGSGGASLGLFGIFKRLKGKSPKSVARETEPDGALVLEVDQHVRISIPPNMAGLVDDGVLRDQLEAVVRPLHRQGIDRLTFKDDAVELATIDKSQADFFRREDGTTTDNDVSEILIPRQRLRADKVSFDPDGKWRLNDGEKTRWYAMKDREFINEIESGARRFGKKDSFICEVIMRQTVDSQGLLHMEYEITKVLEHIMEPERPRLIP